MLQQIQVVSKFSLNGVPRSPDDILSVLPEKAKELIAAKKAIAYPPEKVEAKPEVKPTKGKEVTSV